MTDTEAVYAARNSLATIATTSTEVYRKGELVAREGQVVEVFAYPTLENIPSTQEPVDMVFVTVGVIVATAEARRRDLMRLLPLVAGSESGVTLQQGPSYIHLGADLGDQELALRIMAMGHVLNLWRVVTARELGVEDDEQIRKLAGGGLLYAIGWNDQIAAAWQGAS